MLNINDIAEQNFCSSLHNKCPFHCRCNEDESRPSNAESEQSDGSSVYKSSSSSANNSSTSSLTSDTVSTVLISIRFQGKWVGGVDGEVILTLPCTRALFKNADIIYVLNFLLMWWFHMIKLSPEPWCYRNIYSKKLIYFVLEYMWKDF